MIYEALEKRAVVTTLRRLILLMITLCRFYAPRAAMPYVYLFTLALFRHYLRITLLLRWRVRHSFSQPRVRMPTAYTWHGAAAYADY